MSYPFEGRNEIPYPYSRWGWTRGGGTVWHGGVDVRGLDNKTVRMPWYHTDSGATVSICGTVRSATIVTNKADATWEWGWYVCVQLDADQTPDAVNLLYFAHNEKLLVRVGDRVKSGDALAVMGNSGNAALANPPIEHVHFEVRSAPGTRGLDPTRYLGFANAVGIYVQESGGAVADETLYGLDVSWHQRALDWAAVRRAGKTRFVLARTGLGAGSEGKTDDTFAAAAAFCAENALPLGAYHFSYAASVQEAVDEADACLGVLQGRDCPLGVYFDLEYEGMHWVQQHTGIVYTAQLMQALTVAFCDRVKAAGYAAGVYVNKDLYDRFYGDAFFTRTGLRLWYARPGLSAPDKPCGIWQYATNAGTEYGYAGTVDKNVLFAAEWAQTMPRVEGKRLRVTADNCEYFRTRDVDSGAGFLVRGAVLDIVALEAQDSTVTVDGVQYAGPWCKVLLDDGDEWYCWALRDRCVVETVPQATEPDPETPQDTVQVHTGGGKLYVRELPSTDSEALEALADGTTVVLFARGGGWGYLYGRGWVSLHYVVEV